eukprot:scaffold270272_cov23-Tisochrysis_lutea.AAC.4
MWPWSNCGNPLAHQPPFCASLIAGVDRCPTSSVPRLETWLWNLGASTIGSREELEIVNRFGKSGIAWAFISLLQRGMRPWRSCVSIRMCTEVKHSSTRVRLVVM